jgi:hypothetical protein
MLVMMRGVERSRYTIKVLHSHSSFSVLSEYIVFFENAKMFFDYQKM